MRGYNLLLFLGISYLIAAAYYFFNDVVFDVQMHDTYFVLSKFYVCGFTGLLLCLYFGLYRSMPQSHSISRLANIHQYTTFFTFGGMLLLSVANNITPYGAILRNTATPFALLLLLGLVAQLLFLIVGARVLFQNE